MDDLHLPPVRPSGPWALKLAQRRYPVSSSVYMFRGRPISSEGFGNLHFGYIGNACGIPLRRLVGGGFVVHVATSRYPFSRKALRNEYDDDRAVFRGDVLYWSWGADWEPWWRPSERARC